MTHNGLGQRTRSEKEGITERISIYIKKKVCLFVIYVFGPCKSSRHQTFHDIPLGPEEGRDGVGATEGVGRSPSHLFRKIEEKFLIFQNFWRIFSNFWSTFLLPIPLRATPGWRATFRFKLLPPEYLVTSLLEHYSKCPIQKFVRATVFPITRERKEIKTQDFRHWTGEILGYESMLKFDWSICWPIVFEHNFIVSNILLVKFSPKMFQNDDNVLQRSFLLTPN
jgi:hypothetical protein